MVGPLPSWSEEAYPTHEQFPRLMAAPDESIVHRAAIHQCRTKTSKIKSSALIYQLCSVSPPVNFFAPKAVLFDMNQTAPAYVYLPLLFEI